MPRAFDGVDDEIRLDVGACSSMTYGTLAVIVKHGVSDWGAVMGLHTSAGAGQMFFEFSPSGGFSAKLLCGTNNSNGQFGVSSFNNTTTWYFICVTKDTGSVAPRFHVYDYATNAWTHENAVGTVADGASVSGGTVRLGEYEDIDDFTGDIACAGAWANTTFTDSQIEQSGMPLSLQGWLSMNPSALWVFDQSATTQKVVDLMGGGANESVLNGTAVSTNSVPIFNYYGDVTVVNRPMAAGGGGFTAKFRKTLSGVGTGVGKRQIHGWA